MYLRFPVSLSNTSKVAGEINNLNLGSPLNAYPSLFLFNVCCFLLKQQHIQAHLFTFKKVEISLSGVNITNSCLASQTKKERERENLFTIAIIAFVSVCVSLKH